MFQLDEKFLETVGLSGMPEGEKVGFLAHIQGELESRVGEKLSEGMSGAQIEEFERLIDGDQGVVDKVLAQSGDYRADEAYKMLIGQGGFVDGAPETLAEYASIKWMAINRPDYREVVGKVLEEMKVEIEGNREKLLGARQ